jgi:hypothetical protein
MKHEGPNDTPDGYLAVDNEFRILEMSAPAAERFFRSPGSTRTAGLRREVPWPAAGEFRVRCEQAMAEQTPAHFVVRWNEQQWVRVHAWPSKKALFVCLRDVTHEHGLPSGARALRRRRPASE